MRGRSPRGAQRSRVASSASSTARLARVADRVHGEVEARVARSARPARAAPRRSAAPRRARRRRTARACEAVREPSVPSANALTGPMRSQSSPRPLRSPSATISSSRSAGSEAQTRSAGAGRRAAAASAPRPCSRWKSWMPVTPRACAAPQAVRDAPRRARARRGSGMAAAASQAAVSRRTPVGSPERVALDDGRVADRQARERGRRQPGRVVVVRPQQHGPVAAGGVERGAVRARGRPPASVAERQPAPISQPSAARRRAAAAASTSACERVAERSSRAERERPLQEVHVGVGEARARRSGRRGRRARWRRASGRPRARRRRRRCGRPRSRARAPAEAAGRPCARCRCGGSRG